LNSYVFDAGSSSSANTIGCDLAVARAFGAGNCLSAILMEVMVANAGSETRVVDIGFAGDQDV
jgi:hypothetical protein